MRIRGPAPVLITALVIIALLVAHPAATAAWALASEGGATDSSSRPQFTDEELFRGLVLAHGPVAALFPELAGIPAPSKDSDAAISRLLTRIGSDDPGFMPRFGGAIRSGDPVAVREALVGSYRAIATAAELEFGRQSAALGEPAPDCIVLFVAVVTMAVAVASLAVSVVAAVDVTFAASFTIAVVINYFVPASASDGGQLAQDQWVNSIVRTLTV